MCDSEDYKLKIIATRKEHKEKSWGGGCLEQRNGKMKQLGPGWSNPEFYGPGKKVSVKHSLSHEYDRIINDWPDSFYD